MMKIGIITFHASHNYGSMLQAWALQTFLLGLGHDVEIINFRTSKQRRYYRNPISLRIHGIKQFLSRLILRPSTLFPEQKRWKKFEIFLSENLHVTKEYHTFKELMTIRYSYDAVVCGSDQIWISCADGDKAYFGNFLPSDVKKIAYAPSLGPKPFERIDGNYIKSNLRGFDAISVREPLSKKFIESLFSPSFPLTSAFKNNVTDKSIKVVCDPTLLLSAIDFERISAPDEFVPKGKYIFYYCLNSNPKFVKLAVEIGERYNLPVYTDKSFIRRVKGLEHKLHYWPAIGPKEFLAMIKNSVATCGDSFHLLILSTIFSKKTFCINGAADSRIINILSRMQLEDMAVDTEADIDKCYNLSIDFEKALEDLSSYINSSKQFLLENLLMPDSDPSISTANDLRNEQLDNRKNYCI